MAPPRRRPRLSATCWLPGGSSCWPRPTGAPSGFGFWREAAGFAVLSGVVASDDATYLQLVQAYCQWGAERGLTDCYADLAPRSTTERQWMDALGVLSYVTLATNPADGSPELLRASCELATLADALVTALEDQSS